MIIILIIDRIRKGFCNFLFKLDVGSVNFRDKKKVSRESLKKQLSILLEAYGKNRCCSIVKKKKSLFRTPKSLKFWKSCQNVFNSPASIVLKTLPFRSVVVRRCYKPFPCVFFSISVVFEEGLQSEILEIFIHSLHPNTKKNI